MTILCLGALLAGLAAAVVIPFPPFACAVLAATLIGSALAGIGGAALGSTALSAFMLLLSCQIGYGLGIVIGAVWGQNAARRHAGDEGPAASAARRLRIGNGPS